MPEGVLAAAGGPRRALLGLLLAALGAATMLAIAAAIGWSPFAPDDAAAPLARTERSAQRSLPGASAAKVSLPDELEVAAGTVAQARYAWTLDLGARPARLALYLPGLPAAARITLNDRVLVDELVEPLPPRPRGRQALRLVDLPDALLQPGANRLTVEVAARSWISVSPLMVGERAALRALHDRKALALVTGPVVVAAVIGCLGLSVLLLWVRRPSEAQYGYFGVGASLWSLHTLWTVAPDSLLAPPHLGVWWNTLYAAIVVTLSLFALRFAQQRRAALEVALLRALVVAPLVLYACAAVGALAPATDALRLALVALAFGALGAVALHAWRQRSVAGAMFLAAGAASAGFGLRDWLVFRAGEDNFPVPLTPYAGLPFIVLLSWILIDRFVRTADALETVNHDLESRVALREAELARNFRRISGLEREQAATDERARIMRELHDGLGSKLFTSLARVERGTLDRDGLAEELRGCIADMRLAIETLSPGESDLGASIGNFLFRWESVLHESGVRTDWRVQLPAQGLAIAPQVALQLLRVMQEGLTNVLRHATAGCATLELGVDDAALVLAIADDGRGFDVAATAPGRGLQNMRARAQAIGASFDLASAPGRGTRVDLRLPLARAVA